MLQRLQDVNDLAEGGPAGWVRPGAVYEGGHGGRQRGWQIKPSVCPAHRAHNLHVVMEQICSGQRCFHAWRQQCSLTNTSTDQHMQSQLNAMQRYKHLEFLGFKGVT